MRKLKYILILSLFFLASCQKLKVGCLEVCDSPQKHSNFKSLNIEKQFEYFRACNCNYDSVLARAYWANYIGEREEAIRFLLNKLENEQDEEVLVDTLYILRATTEQQDIKGRNYISELVNQTVDRISDKDERGLVSKIIFAKQDSRKERLTKLAKEIEGQVLSSPEKYRQEIIDYRNKKLADEQLKKTQEQKNKEEKE
jgi:hypothetical protein